MSQTYLGITCHIAECITCGIPIAVPLSVYQQYQKRGGFYHCANGHSQGWDYEDSVEGKIKKERNALRRERDRLKQQNAQLEDEARENLELALHHERSASAYKGQVTKLKKRASAGVCPCCNRSFTNLRRHMATKHPDYVAEPEPLEVIEGGKESA